MGSGGRGARGVFQTLGVTQSGHAPDCWKASQDLDALSDKEYARVRVVRWEQSALKAEDIPLVLILTMS
jgi:hypothetical protein